MFVEDSELWDKNTTTANQWNRQWLTWKSKCVHLVNYNTHLSDDSVSIASEIFNCTFDNMTEMNILTSDEDSCRLSVFILHEAICGTKCILPGNYFLKHLSVVSHFDSRTVQLQIIVLSRIIINEVIEVRLEL